MNQPKVSIIVPVHNAEDTIYESFKSAASQTLKNIEIIFIDNNSSDKSIELIKKMQVKDSRIKLLFEGKQGAGPARNKGLKEARGEYVFFLDPDDWIYDNTTLEKLYKIAKQKRVMIAGGSVYSVDPATGKEQIAASKYYFENEGFISYRDYQFDWGFWRFIYNRQFLKDNQIEFPPYLRGQDTVFFVKAMIAAEKFYAIKDPTYRYNYSFSDKKHSKKSYIDYEKANLDVIGLAKKHGLSELEKTAQSHRTPLISVIVPIYNVEKYLPDCLDSILAQTYRNLEIILVDDKTPDSSGKIADEYAKKDERIKVIHKPKNEGLNMARATGFKASTGDYITFVDSDDMLTKYCLDTAIQTLLKNNTDFVRFGILSFKDKNDLNSKLKNPPENREIILNTKSDLYKTQITGLPQMNFLMCVWGALYFREPVEKINWKESNYRINEDNIWMLRFFENANSGTYISNIGYLYRYDDTLTSVLSKKVTGNSLNGKPIGYLEYIDSLIKEYRKYNKHYNIGADEQIDAFASWQWTYRLKQLTINNALNSENNSKFLQEALKWLFQGYDKLETQYVNEQDKARKLEAELNKFLGIKRSARLFAGNTKRRIKKFLN